MPLNKISTEDYSREVLVGNFSAECGPARIYYKTSRPLMPVPDMIHLYIVHGAVEHHGRHLLLPEYLLKRWHDKLIVTWIDLKGHGLSSGSRSHCENFDEFCLDLVTLFNMDSGFKEYISQRFILGHSMGGLIALKTYFEYSNRFDSPLSGLIISNPSLKLKEPNRWKGRGEKVLNWIPSFAGKIRVISPFNGHHLCTDSQKALDFNSDHLINRYLSVNLLQEMSKSVSKIINQSYYMDKPSLFLLSGQDRLVDTKATELFVKGIPPEYKTIIRYNNMYHEIFNDINREDAFADIYNWIERL